MLALHGALIAAISALWIKVWQLESKLEDCMQGQKVDSKQLPL
jgi:hypothetical protein